jgi:hypothetical protein
MVEVPPVGEVTQLLQGWRAGDQNPIGLRLADHSPRIVGILCNGLRQL